MTDYQNFEARSTERWPFVSIIIPCYNEQATIRHLLDALLHQSYPLERMEVIIADGLSEDQTREQISSFSLENSMMTVRVVDNPMRNIPAALNLALRVSQGEIVVRLDAHSIPYPNYVEQCVQDLSLQKGDNVGGVWEIHPATVYWLSRAIARAASHPLGAGDARYRLGGSAQKVDTVPFGAYQKQFVLGLGGYDENLLTNEDYELNVRIRRAGGTVWFNPEIRSIYYARSDLGALARQYMRYGWWKARMLRRHPDTLRWRQLLPPLFVIATLLLTLCGLIFPPALLLLGIGLGGYFLILFAAGVQAALKYSDPGLILGLPAALFVMHFAWGSAFLGSLVWR